MKSNYKNQFVALILGVIVYVGCTEPYTPNLGTTYTRVAIEGSVTDDSMQLSYVRVSKSADYLGDARSVVIEDAMVSVVETLDTLTFKDADTISYIYHVDSMVYYPQSHFVGKPEHFYKLLVSNVDVDNNGAKESYSAVDRLPKAFFMGEDDSISMKYISQPQFDFWAMTLYAYEPPERNFYAFHKIKNGVFLSDTISDWRMTEDQFYNGNYTNGVDVQSLSNTDSIEWPEVGDVFTFEMWNISENYYNYIVQVQQVVGYQNPLFSGPPANPQHNIKGGGVGFFAAYSITRLSKTMTHIPEEALERREKEMED